MTTTKTHTSKAVQTALAARGVPVHDLPAVTAAREAMERTCAVAEMRKRRFTGYVNILDDNRRAGGDLPTASNEQYLDAIQHVQAARVEWASAEAEVLQAITAHDRAVAAARQERETLLIAATKEVAAELYRLLDQAASGPNEILQQLDQLRRDVNGGHIEVPAAWPELTPSSDVFQGLLDQRRQVAEREGLL